jgi:peroxiredoxin
MKHMSTFRIGCLVFIISIVVGRYWYMTPNYEKGEYAPDFEATLRDGTSVSMNDLKGKYVLVDFWGSWCFPCRKSNIKIRELWEEFNNSTFEQAEGFVIVSIAVEENDKSWEQAIVQDKLSWRYHILDVADNLRFFNSPLSDLWGVNQVPTTFLIDAKGKILGINLPYSKIHQILQQG